MTSSPTVRTLMDAIATGDQAGALRLLAEAPELARASLSVGATRQAPGAGFVPALGCYFYEGDTALHAAAAAWRPDLIRRLIAAGADVSARNRRGASALHYAASGDPDARRFDPAAQAEAIAALAGGGADPNASDKSGATPLHRAIRTRCAAATEALLRLGADPGRRTRNGSTPARLAEVSSGRGGSGSAAAKAGQARIVEILARGR